MKEGVVAAAPPLTVPVVWSFLGYSFPAGSMIVGLLACLMIRLFITLDTPGPKRWLLDGIVTGIALLVTAVWIAEHQVDLFAALGTGGTAGAVGAGIISFFKRRGQSAIDALDAALPGKPAVPPEMAATLREIDKQA
ncbi:MAG: hypothetical protein PGN16_10670 [Sphingomonas phyllosphaerae]|uniref:hypothetical protein n=1 Tax=Sphingomonas phyllosphaerae TaxID=257003 RepID=UPI002FFBBECE